MKPTLLSPLLAACGLCLATAVAHDDHDHAPYPEAKYYAPTPVPDRVVLTWTGDPATTQAVTWRTSTDVDHGLGQIALAQDGPQNVEPTVVAATTQAHTSNLSEAHYHTVEFTGLAPDTLYAYRVGDGVDWTEWHHFRTARAEAAPFSFIYFGDAQNDVRTHWSRVFRESFRSAPRAAFTLHAGDLINRAQQDGEWGQWFGAPAWVHATVPVIATPGNHEFWRAGAGPETDRLWTLKSGATLAVTAAWAATKDADGQPTGYEVQARTADGRLAQARLGPKEEFVWIDPTFTEITGYTLEDLHGREPDHDPLRDRMANPGTRTLSTHWRPQFAFPTHGPTGLEETAYYLDYQGARIISLNSTELLEAQVPWLRQVLATNPQRWTILTFHHPVFSPARNRDNPELRRLWKPIIDEFKVDLVLTGHDHTYARSGDMTALSRGDTANVPTGFNQVYDPAIGTVYVVSVSGPKMYDLTGDWWAVRTAEDTQLFQVITVDGDELRYEARTATGRLYDAFTLHKRAGQANELREALPPENRR